MAIAYCHKHETQWDRDKHTDAPCCDFIGHLMSLPGVPDTAATMPIPVKDEPRDLIRDLSEGYPWQAKDAELHKRVKRVLGEA